jgi:predicted nucleic acid-binding protein
VASISAFELRLGADFVARRGPIELLLVHQTLPLDLSAAILAGEVLTRLRRKGVGIGVNDALIAGTCLRFEVPLATRNRSEFDRVDDLTLIEIGH